MACIGGGLLSRVITGCSSTHYVTGVIELKGISIPQSEFVIVTKKGNELRQFVVVHHEKLEFPIFLFRLSDNSYSALWMKCTHQGSELQASGDHLYCTSHGSEFDKYGKVQQGPAEKSLRSFPVSVHDDQIFIELS